MLRLPIDSPLNPSDSSAEAITLRGVVFGRGEWRGGPLDLAVSPGERTRAELALLAARGASLILLDEPSNHLDVEALEVLEAALEGWCGALVLASHDREMRKRVRTDREVSLA